MRAIVTAGGTGGHIYPALAIIEKIKEREPESEFIYIGTHNRMECQIIPSKNIRYIPIKIYGFSKNIFRDIKNVFYISKAISKCKKIIKSFNPDIVIGAGGYVTYPVLKAANKLRIKTFIHEQNAIPGKSNKMLSRFVDAIGVSYSSSKEYFKKSRVIVTGNPCSERAFKEKAISKAKLGLSKNKKLITIVAGSLGSFTLNKIFKVFLKNAKAKKYEIVYITGKNYYEDFIKNEKYPENVYIYPYLDNLVNYLKSSDLIITRSGASTISEIIALELPNILIPSPYVPNNHQYYNALELSNIGAGILLEEKDLNEDVLNEKIDFILNTGNEYINMKNKLKTLQINDSAEKIYETIKGMII